MPRSPCLAYKAPVMQAKDVEKSQTGRVLLSDNEDRIFPQSLSFYIANSDI